MRECGDTLSRVVTGSWSENFRRSYARSCSLCNSGIWLMFMWGSEASRQLASRGSCSQVPPALVWIVQCFINHPSSENGNSLTTVCHLRGSWRNSVLTSRTTLKKVEMPQRKYAVSICIEICRSVPSIVYSWVDFKVMTSKISVGSTSKSCLFWVEPDW